MGDASISDVAKWANKLISILNDTHIFLGNYAFSHARDRTIASWQKTIETLENAKSSLSEEIGTYSDFLVNEWFETPSLKPANLYSFHSLVKLGKKVEGHDFITKMDARMRSANVHTPGIYEEWVNSYYKAQDVGLEKQTMIQCRMCDSSATHTCAGCEKEHYCGTSCQSKAWEAHQFTCKTL